jgi:transcriptional regulator with XRE-family HTH domain
MAETARRAESGRPQLRYARLSRGLTVERAAEGARLGVSTIKRLEAGAPASPHTIRRLADYYRLSPAALGLLPERVVLDGPTTTPHSGDGGGDALKGREALSLLGAPSAWPSPARDLHDRREDLPDDVAALRTFRAADPQLGGGHMYSAVVRYLEASVAPRLFGRLPGNRGPDVFCVAAALTDFAGWMAHDAGRDGLADQHFAGALALARAGGDPELEANILASRGHLILQQGKPAEALALLRAAQVLLRRGRQNRGLKARLHAIEARCLAARRERVDCVYVLGQAERTLTPPHPKPESEWTQPFDEASLASEAAQSFRLVGLLGEARRQAERVIELRATGRARSRAFGQVALASILAEQGDLDHACSLGHEVLRTTTALSSVRVVQQLQELRRLLAPHRSSRAVGEFLAHSADDLRGRVVLYHWLRDGAQPAS